MVMGIRVFCDECDEELQTDALSVHDAVLMLRPMGWRYVNGQDEDGQRTWYHYCSKRCNKGRPSSDASAVGAIDRARGA